MDFCRGTQKRAIHGQVERQPQNQVSLFHAPPDSPLPIIASINQIPQEARVKEKAIDEVSKSWSSGARGGW